MNDNIIYELNKVANFRLFGFATGTYTCGCSVCQKAFTGDKRATQCLECAVKQAYEYQNIYLNNGGRR